MSNSLYFIWLSKAWYAEPSLRGRDYIDEIMINDNGVNGEIAIRWYPLRDRISPQLEAFADSWALLASNPELILMLGELDATDLLPDEMAEILSNFGIRDNTPTKSKFQEETDEKI